MTKTVLSVPDISCEHCERAITGALTPQPGIERVQVDIPAKRVSLEFDEAQIDLDQVARLLDDEGYPVAGQVV